MSTVPFSTSAPLGTWPLPPVVANEGNDYPTRDGRPMGETDLHRKVMYDLIETLTAFYKGQQVYVSGNILLFYRPGNKRRHVSPDVMVVKGLETKLRKNYLLWQEELPPNIVMEITSESTRDEDLEDKFEIYRDEVRVAEYFLFDPFNEYLNPQLQGWRLKNGTYSPVETVEGRLFSEQLGLHLQAEGPFLRLFDPQTNRKLPTPQEREQESGEAARKAKLAEKLAEEKQRMAEEAQRRAEEAQRQAQQALQRADAESERLRQELAELKKKLS